MTPDTAARPALEIPRVSAATAGPTLDGVLGALVTQLSELNTDDGTRPTDCSRWDVRAMIAHVVASTQEAAKPWLTPARLWRGRRHHRDLALLDARNEWQTELFAGDLTTLRRELAELRGPAVAGVGRLPGAIGRIRVPSGLPGIPTLRIDYVVHVLSSRDSWMHGVDLAHATGRPRIGGPHDAAVIDQVIRDLALGWIGPPIDLTVAGAGAGRWLIGSGVPAAELRADGVQLCRLLAGRPAGDPVDLVTGDPAAASALASARVLF